MGFIRACFWRGRGRNGVRGTRDFRVLGWESKGLLFGLTSFVKHALRSATIYLPASTVLVTEMIPKFVPK